MKKRGRRRGKERERGQGEGVENKKIRNRREKNQNFTCVMESISRNEHVTITFAQKFDPRHPQWICEKGVKYL